MGETQGGIITGSKVSRSCKFQLNTSLKTLIKDDKEIPDPFCLVDMKI